MIYVYDPARTLGKIRSGLRDMGISQIQIVYTYSEIPTEKYLTATDTVLTCWRVDLHHLINRVGVDNVLVLNHDSRGEIDNLHTLGVPHLNNSYSITELIERLPTQNEVE